MDEQAEWWIDHEPWPGPVEDGIETLRPGDIYFNEDGVAVGVVVDIKITARHDESTNYEVLLSTDGMTIYKDVTL